MKYVHFIDRSGPKPWSLAIFSDNEARLGFQIVGQNLMLPPSAGYAYFYNGWELVILQKRGLAALSSNIFCLEQTAKGNWYWEGLQPIVGNIVPNGIGEADGLTIINGCDINAATLELIDECMVVTGTHRGPAGITDQGVENCY